MTTKLSHLLDLRGNWFWSAEVSHLRLFMTSMHCDPLCSDEILPYLVKIGFLLRYWRHHALLKCTLAKISRSVTFLVLFCCFFQSKILRFSVKKRHLPQFLPLCIVLVIVCLLVCLALCRCRHGSRSRVHFWSFCLCRSLFHYNSSLISTLFHQPQFIVQSSDFPPPLPMIILLPVRRSLRKGVYTRRVFCPAQAARNETSTNLGRNIGFGPRDNELNSFGTDLNSVLPKTGKKRRDVLALVALSHFLMTLRGRFLLFSSSSGR